MEEAMQFRQCSHCVGSVTSRAEAEEHRQVGDDSIDCSVLHLAPGNMD